MAGKETEDRGDYFDDDDDDEVRDTDLEGEGTKDEGAEGEDTTPEDTTPEGEDEEDKGKGHMVPLSRFRGEVEKQRAAREAAELRAEELERQLQLQKAPSDDRAAKLTAQSEALEAAYAKALADGEYTEATRVLRELRATDRALVRLEGEGQTLELVGQQIERQRFQSVVARLEEQYPELNPKGEAFDADLTDTIVGTRNLYVERGLPLAEALEKAVATVMGREAKRPSGGKGLAEPVEDRGRTQVAKNLDARRRQPPRLDVGLDTDKAGPGPGKIDVDSMSDEDFAKLPEATKKKLRGD